MLMNVVYKKKKLSLITKKRITKPIFQTAAIFEGVDNSPTKLVFKMLFNPADECRKVKKMSLRK